MAVNSAILCTNLQIIGCCRRLGDHIFCRWPLAVEANVKIEVALEAYERLADAARIVRVVEEAFEEAAGNQATPPLIV